ncbi:hypothetical protein BGZ73_004052 [Actinomortierella ambigua]|nr:hypothetical protein BGZ73_004052 [Actinomortierella ambigua]
MTECNLRDIPEFVEKDYGESLQARTEALASFKELGPPDLVHIVKVNSKPGVKESSSYHYVSGIDASSSASLAAYLNSLTYALDETQTWFSKAATWRIGSGTYCCYNAFSRVDMRVEVKIPGGVESYAVNARNERLEATTTMWHETNLTALLRSILYSDDVNYRLPGFRKIDPIPDVASQGRLFEAAERLFFRGWLLGSNPEIQVPTIVNNHLTAGIMKYCKESFRYDLAVQFFERLYQREPEVASLLAQSYIGTDEELKAINVLYRALKHNPQSYALLHVQSDFLREKGKLEMGLRLAKQAVNCAPSEFITWAKLTEVYIDLGDYESALLTLNSCPMFTFNERDLQRMPKPAKVHLPIRSDLDLHVIEDEVNIPNEADPALLRLPAPTLRGTFSSAYGLLTRIVAKIGWDELLRCRSTVFVMEEEYRLQKEAEENLRKSAKAKIMRRHSNEEDEFIGRQSEQQPPTDVPDREQLLSPNGTPIPIIKISTESEREREAEQEAIKQQQLKEEEEEEEEAKKQQKKDEDENKKDEANGSDDGEQSLEDVMLDDLSLNGDKDDGEAEAKKGDETEADKEAAIEADSEEKTEAESEEKADETRDKEDDSVQQQQEIASQIQHKNPEKPRVAAAAPEDESDDSRAEEEEIELSFSFSNKRLCDRWLDNLFMVLYEDLRQYTIWRAEVQHFRQLATPYRKPAADWEILGDLATRLHHKEEAKEAYFHCTQQKFSARSLVRLLEIYADEGELHKAMEVAIKLSVYQDRWYHETVFPTAIAHSLNKLIQQHGLAKVNNTLLSLDTSPGVFKLMSRFLNRAKTFEVPGFSR